MLPSRNVMRVLTSTMTLKGIEKSGSGRLTMAADVAKRCGGNEDESVAVKVTTEGGISLPLLESATCQSRCKKRGVDLIEATKQL